jgi:hypothetical protein
MNGTLNVSCTNCHGFPPSNHPPQATDCAACHGDTLAAGTHMNGRVDVARSSCVACHGAPPPPPHYPSAQTEFACARCHSATINAGGLLPDGAHMDGRVNHDCAICHGYPPPPPHPVNDDCVLCHGNNIANNTHLNGTVNFAPEFTP